MQPSDIVYKKSTSDLGGTKTATVIQSAAPNNLYGTASASEAISGVTQHKCFYLENTHSTETAEECHLFLQSDNPNSVRSTVQWAIDPVAQHPLYPFTSYVYGDGNTDYIDCTNDATLWSQSLTKFSFSIWVFPTIAFDGTTRFILRHGTGNLRFQIHIDSTVVGKVYFRIVDSGGINKDAAATNLNLNQWNHVVCVYDSTLGSANLKIYCNGNLGSTTADTTVAVNQSAALLILNNAADAMGGFVRDFRWWTTKALTLAEVQDIYFGRGDDITTNYWLLIDEGTGNCTDEISGSKIGTLTNAVWKTSQTIASLGTSPVGVTWRGVTNGPVSATPNIGNLTPASAKAVPVWVKWIISANASDAQNDYCLFVLQGKIPEGGTGGGDGGGTPPPTPSAFNFVAVGDWGCESMTGTVVSQCIGLSPELVLGLGDNNYDDNGSISCWLSRIKPIEDANIRLETAFGNHDNGESASSSTESATKNHFGYTNTYYSFDIQNVHFLVLDNTTETSFTSGSAQHTFATNDLAAARSNAAIDWVVVAIHKPMWGASSSHGYNDGNFNQAYGALFDQHKVDLILSGHNHNWQSTKQTTYNSGSPTSPTVVDSATPYTGGVGRIHCVVGTGGHDSGSALYSLGSQPGFQEYQNRTFNGVLNCVLSNSNKTMTCSFIATDGEAKFTFVINR